MNGEWLTYCPQCRVVYLARKICSFCSEHRVNNYVYTEPVPMPPPPPPADPDEDDD